MRQVTWPKISVLIAATFAIFVSGCTCPRDYIRNCFKVGPSFCKPSAPVAPHWIDIADERVVPDPAMPNAWWTLFHDPTLDTLISQAAGQNLTLREAGFRILEARAQFGIARGNIFPQTQTAFGGYQREAASQNANSSPGFGTQFYDQWYDGFNLSWELDFWGRFRRAIAAAEDTLGASSANYNQVLVTLQGDVAFNYVLMRTLQQRLEYVRSNVELQGKLLDIADRRLKAGAKGAGDVHQARSNLAQTESQVPQLQLAIRQACNRLCILMGMPPMDLEKELGTAPIPTAPPTVAVGIPADLLRRRPDVRRAELLAAAQGEQIGIAEAALYPAFSINGTLGWQSQNSGKLFESKSIAGTVGPVFQWNILNYGRIRNNMRAQDAEFRALVLHYQNTVLQASAEVENGIAMFLRSQERAKLLDISVENAQQAATIVGKEYQGGATSFNQVALIQQNLVVQQDLQAQAHGEIAQGLIQIYRALGGGWQANAMESETVVVNEESAEVVNVPSDDPNAQPAEPTPQPNKTDEEPLPAPAEPDGN